MKRPVAPASGNTSKTRRQATLAAALELLEARRLLASFVVDSVTDGGAGSLRQASVDANSEVGADVIAFELSGDGPHTIGLASALPDLADDVEILCPGDELRARGATRRASGL